MLKPLRWLSHTSPDAVGISLMLADTKIAADDAAFHSALKFLTLQRYKKYLKTCKTVIIFYEILKEIANSNLPQACLLRMRTLLIVSS